MEYIKLFEDFHNDDENGNDTAQVAYFLINGETVVRLDKSNTEGNKWGELHVSGKEIYNFGRKTYMGYLTPNDLLGWLRKDYDNVEIIDEEDIENHSDSNFNVESTFYKWNSDEFEAQSNTITMRTADDKVYDIIVDGGNVSVELYDLDTIDIDEFFGDATEIEISSLDSIVIDALNQKDLL